MRSSEHVRCSAEGCLVDVGDDLLGGYERCYIISPLTGLPAGLYHWRWEATRVPVPRLLLRRPRVTAQRLSPNVSTGHGISQLSATGRDECLTLRELEVLRQVGTGAANPEIAESLAIAAATVKTHLNHAMAILHLTSRAQAVVPYETGLVVPNNG